MFSENKTAFTLIEIMLVVIIIGILAAMVIPNMAGRSEQARVAAAHADIDANLGTALDLYELDNGQYPTTEQGLKALLVKPSSSPVPTNWHGPYLKKKRIPVDPWGREYKYTAPGINNTEEFDLSSYGPDGVESQDDIVNWPHDLSH
ncbi:MAG: type II secretion system major pseudopilin GspG [Candidatus Omnitrophica bacterium]|nr:type II secretion system major pseudopilin GspG [Candidatus Omnitrophota bacterium]MBI5023376.1 type II secretion system major pseudopilin GspG [Candidatus Omnitrophota bacterium]